MLKTEGIDHGFHRLRGWKLEHDGLQWKSQTFVVSVCFVVVGGGAGDQCSVLKRLGLSERLAAVKWQRIVKAWPQRMAKTCWTNCSTP
jgi:hypothetical protein